MARVGVRSRLAAVQDPWAVGNSVGDTLMCDDMETTWPQVSIWSDPAATLPLKGVRVLDLTLALAGPLCTQRLGDMGAEIIKIEGPDRPDFTRNSPILNVRLGGETTPFLSLNRNKRSLALDLKSQRGKEIFYDLAATADVVIQNMRPGVAERLGLSFEKLREVNDKIVYVSISGYGEGGPMVGRPGQDLLVQSFSGTVMNAGRVGGTPHPSPVFIADVAASHNACEAVLAGLIHRDREGVAVEAKVTLLQATLEIQIQELMTYLTTGARPELGNAPSASMWMEPPYGIYKTSDGHMAIAQTDLTLLASTLEAPALAKAVEARPESYGPAMWNWRDQIYATLSQVLANRLTGPTVELLSDVGVWCGPVHDYADLVAHPQAAGLFAEIEHASAGTLHTLAPVISFTTSPEPPLSAPPQLGEHTDEILTAQGYSEDERNELRAEGVVA